MTEHDALLRAVIQNPDDDTPRLIFADWLEENGEPDRAAFIRCQCELAKMNDLTLWGCSSAIGSCRSPYCPYLVKHKQYRELEDSQYWLWASAIKRHEEKVIPYVLNDWFSRGFLERLILDWPTFRNHADTLTASHPIREVTLTTMPTNWMAYGQHGMTFEVPNGEMRFETTEGYSELCRMFKDWLNSEWPRITFTLPPEPRQFVLGTQSLDEMRESIDAMMVSVGLNPASSPRSGQEPTA